MNMPALTSDSPAPRLSEGVPARLRRLLRNRPQVEVHGEQAELRAASEQYVRDTFERAYGADVTSFAPLLLEIRCLQSISGVAGMRPAARNDLFLERYLDAPVEAVMSEAFAKDVRRDEIIEVCNLAALRPGACQLITLVMAASVHAAGYRYGVITATEQLLHILIRQGFCLLKLADADPAVLGADAASWGTYYETRPVVTAVDLDASLANFRHHLLSQGLIDFLSEDSLRISSTLAATRFAAYAPQSASAAA